MNYIFYGVKTLGKILNCHKLPSPKALGKKPRTKHETEELTIYNIRDSEISYKFIRFLFVNFEKMNTKPKMTIASTTLDNFRRNYLKNDYIVNDKNICLEMLNAYYGGRCEAFRQGKFYSYNYYDFCSLYPAVMRNKVPDPNSLRILYSSRTDLNIIKKYQGISKITIKTPNNLYYPVLPVKTKTKLLFPLGKISGYWTHAEICKALDMGYKILDIDKTFYYKKSAPIFKEFVEDVYKRRMYYKKKGDPVQLLYKLLLNSLYGKFAQHLEHEYFAPAEQMDQVREGTDFERVGNFIRWTETKDPTSFNIMIWSIYITSFARLLLYDEMIKLNPIYVDTDSLITAQNTRSGLELGNLELEYQIKKGIVLKPKFYAFMTNEDKEILKIKGISEYMNFSEFEKRINKNCSYARFKYKKFCKFKEAIRRGIYPNEIMHMIKRLSKKDEKRDFSLFNVDTLNESKPLYFPHIQSISR